MKQAQKSSTEKILRNSLWYGLETVLEAVVFLGSSVAVARYLGPQKLGYFSYINFFVSIVNNTSGMGLASATRKYMSEYLAAEQPGMARAVYALAYRYQLLGALLVTALGLTAVLLWGDPAFRTMSVLLILSIPPGILSWIPAQANSALEDVSQNTFSALAYLLTYGVVITLTLVFHWDLVGVASAALTARSVEAVLRTVPLHRRLRSFPLAILPQELKHRIRRYCLQATGIQLITALVWDRFEFLFLRAFSGLAQIAFYSVSFGFANNLLMVPRVFGGAVGITLMLESGRKDAGRVRDMVAAACRYLLFFVCPIHLGAIALAGAAVSLVYGAKYAGAVPVLMVAALLAIPRAFQDIADILVRAADRQKYLFPWLIVSGLINLALDALLIPRFGAIGAAWGNGLAQVFGVAGIWREAARAAQVSFPFRSAWRFLASAAVMAATAFAISHFLPGVPGVCLALATSVPLYILGLRATHALRPDDADRFRSLTKRLPLSLRSRGDRVFAFLIPFQPELPNPLHAEPE